MIVPSHILTTSTKARLSSRKSSVYHDDSPDELTNIGHDIESVALNRAVRWHAEHRVFVRGNRTIVLR